MSILLLDNAIYGLTKAQTSPTTPVGDRSNTHPKGSFFVPINPLSVTLGVANVSFVAQTVDWNPPHLYATLRAAHEHRGASFVRVFQRCPHYTEHVFAEAQRDPSKVLYLKHPDGIQAGEAVERLFQNQIVHDPADLDGARRLAGREEVFPIGLFYHNHDAERYDEVSALGLGMSPSQKQAGVEKSLDYFTLEWTDETL